MRISGRGWLVAGILGVLAAVAVAGEPEYKPYRAPMIPGVRRIAEREQAKKLAPYISSTGGDVLFASDLGSEVNRGGTNSAASLGNGRLSAQVSPWADLTVLRWPSPLFGDQLRYWTLAGNAERPVRMEADAPSPDWRRYGHPQEPCRSLGSRGGVQLESGEVVWIGDPSWTSARAFTPEDSTVLTTTLTRPDLTVAVTDFIAPDQDLLVRHFQFTGSARRFFYHGTFAAKVPDPAEGDDWVRQDQGFAAAWLADEKIMVHFRPANLKSAQPLAAAPATASALDALYPGGGAFVAYGLLEPVAGFQVGADNCETKPAAGAPASGYDEASAGRLSGSAFANGLANSVLAADLSSGQATVLISVAGSAEAAAGIIRAARAAGVAPLQSAAVAHWQKKAAAAHLPAQADPVSRRVLTRSILNILTGQDTDSGAIVASVSRQPPYHYDYPRDGAFFDLALDLAGFLPEVTRHHQFLVRTQYRRTIGFSPVWMVNFRSPVFNPSGNWPQKISVDGSSPTNFLSNPCEIDETALTVWNMWRHEKTLPAAERGAYVNSVRDTFVRSCESLLDWVDLRRGWTRPAIEDDSFPPEATLHGVSSTLTAMAAACDAGPRWGLPEKRVARYCAAARALKAGLRGRSVHPEMLDRAGFRGLAWSLWPAPAFDSYQEPGARALKERLAESIRRKSTAEAPGFAYLGEEIMGLAFAERKTGEHRALLEQAFVLLTHQAAFPGTDCYGEITMWGDYAGTGERVSQQRTAIPHVWNGAAVYIAAIALYEPEKLEFMRPPVP